MTNSPLVSIIIPCYNEERYISHCLDSIISTNYSTDLLEIIIVDGMSNDNTREILTKYRRKYNFIKVVDNPQRIKPHALNLGIHSARGKTIIRMDAHATYEPDYITNSLKYLEEFKADNVGGIRKTVPGSDSRMARAIAHLISHPFAAGNATYRTGSGKVKWVDTVFGGCYRREVFDRIGFFNEALIRGQDREFNVRLLRNGGKILFAPDIVCHYFARSSLVSYLKWIYVCGLTPFYITRITNSIIFSWRNLVPLAFVISLCGSFGFSSLYHSVLSLFFGILTIYFIAAIGASVPIARKEKDIYFLANMPFLFLATHIGYGLGSLVGLVKPIRSRSQWTKT
jgi:glycosyltransferase involved in cell wall biosynthesis